MFDERVHSKRDQQRVATRKRILGAAQRLFVADGFEATTIRRIAAAAEVSVGSVMAVGDKDTLLLMAFDRWIGAVHEQRAASPPLEFDDPVRGAREVVQPFLDLFASHPDLAREYGAILGRGAHRTDVFGDLAGTLTSEFEQVASGAGLGDQSPAVARALYYGYLGLLRAANVAGADPRTVGTGLEDIATTVLRTNDVTRLVRAQTVDKETE